MFPGFSVWMSVVIVAARESSQWNGVHVWGEEEAASCLAVKMLYSNFPNDEVI